jgi:hypothetical protein
MIGTLLLIGSLWGAAAEPPAQDALRLQVQGLLKQLDDDALATREAAEQKLIRLGPDVLKLLPRVTPKTPAESAERLKRIRTALEKAEAEATAQASTVTLQGEMPLSKALAAVEQQTRNKIVDLREKFGQQRTDPPVKAEFRQTPFWQALDGLLDQAGLTLYSFGGQAGSVAFVARGDGLPKRTERAAYSGLFRFEATRIQATRDLRNPAAKSLRLQLDVQWEPRLSPILVQLPLSELRAEDEAGRPIAVDGERGKLEAPVENTIAAVELQLPFELPERGVAKLAKLHGTLLALVPGEIETFEFADLEKAKGAEQRRGGVTVTLDQRKNLEVYELRVRVRFERAENALESHRAWVYSNEAYLVDAEGKPVEHDGYQAFRQQANEVGVAYLFSHEPGLKGCKFVYKTPAALVKVPAQFTLQDIPLP